MVTAPAARAVRAARAASAWRRFRAHPTPRFAMTASDAMVMLDDASESTGFDRHYVFHTPHGRRACWRAHGRGGTSTSAARCSS